MASRNAVFLIDGITSVEAVRRKAHTGQPSCGRIEADRSLPEASPSGTRRARFAHTVVPERHEVTCYLCGFAFTVSGRIRKMFCPKCRESLNPSDYAISGTWNEPVTTIGRIWIGPNAQLATVPLRGRCVEVEGDASPSPIEALRLTLGPGGQVDPSHTRFRDLVVRQDADVAWEGPLRCRRVDVAGRLRADLEVSEKALIRPTGHLEGTVSGPCLVVEEGGALHATVVIRAGARDPLSNGSPAPIEESIHGDRTRIG